MFELLMLGIALLATVAVLLNRGFCLHRLKFSQSWPTRIHCSKCKLSVKVDEFAPLPLYKKLGLIKEKLD